MEKALYKNRLQEIAILYATNIRKTAIILPLGLFFIILAMILEQSEWLMQYGTILMTIAMFFWCNATRHLLKYIKIKRLAKENGDE